MNWILIVSSLILSVSSLFATSQPVAPTAIIPETLEIDF